MQKRSMIASESDLIVTGGRSSAASEVLHRIHTRHLSLLCFSFYRDCICSLTGCSPLL
jgi:hypothetical protein